MRIYTRTLIILIITLSFSFGCKEKNQHPVPNLPVNIILNLSLPAYQNLNTPSGWAYVNGGSKGIIVYRSFDKFVAFDRHTTYSPDSLCAIAEVDTANFFKIDDPCSSSQYSILDGTVSQGPAKWGLKPYFASWDGGSVVQITN